MFVDEKNTRNKKKVRVSSRCNRELAWIIMKKVNECVDVY